MSVEAKRLFSQSNKQGWRNPWVIGWISLLVIVLGVNIGMVSLAVITNPGLVDRDFYDSGQAMEQQYRKRQAARTALGWDLELDLPKKSVAGRPDVYRLNLLDKQGQPIRGADVRLTAYRPSDASADFDVALKEAAAGRYDGYLALPLKGIWDLRVHVSRGEDSWDITRRISAEAS
ncbi:FixH family protein [Thiohalomonas denitrificans]|uniref:Nitrogen fixation protein FixH n=1 Tax=Thiohalomonas denitrificans TaxID=415747 RepID=A0A1G5QH89_9GAMM|nr:FixH family protein [Thiohalomonas denitrificans]SCZ60900.1 Nitrogen fixation protein FixH [Thiohalomonas denitrificans]